MALTKGKIKINNIEYDVKSCKVEIAGLEADDSGRTDDGVYFIWMTCISFHMPKGGRPSDRFLV